MAAKRPSRVRVREPVCSSLPPEVWIHILSYHTDLAHLWVDCRRVSSTLRACAEYTFGEYFLKDVHIDFQLEKYNLGGKSKRPEVPVTFARLGKREEKEVAWYGDKRAKETLGHGRGKREQERYDMVMYRWEENLRGWKPEMPNYTIRIGDLVNDTALPGLDIIVAEREIRFEWKKMLHLFFREHERLLDLKKDWRTRTAKIIRANNKRLAKGEKLMAADFPPPWSVAGLEIRKHIRRARLKEQYIEDEEMIWAIDSLRHFEQYGAATGITRAFKLDADLPGAGLGEKWFGSTNLVQELYLDEWSCLHRIDTKIEHMQSE
ncbi:hypothetical protein BKA66DRAFT_472152 [Pyrenochaeta sp. MPI-SDFR-AT-0127]|nr:hypothetical protein BKA66DRAFT_472152 [Pyrenochaeta sp. MPI-SDFR-AT-0127]